MYLYTLAIPAVSYAESGKRDFRDESLKQEIRKILRKADAETGVAVTAAAPVSCAGKVPGMTDIMNPEHVIRIGDHRRYPLMSVMKMHQALCVTDSLARAGLPLDTGIDVTEEDLKPDTYSPLRDSLMAVGRPAGTNKSGSKTFNVTVRTLLRYTLQQSDNNACDILFRHFGGPPATDRYIRSLGIGGFSIKMTEEQMHSNLSLCNANWSTPSSAAGLLWSMISAGSAGCNDGILDGNIYLDFILQTMTDCTTGRDRLAAPLHGTNAVIGHKTGTGDTDSRGRIIGLNDAGFIILPDGRFYTIAVFVRNSKESMTDTARLIADISDAVYRHMVSQ